MASKESCQFLLLCLSWLPLCNFDVFCDKPPQNDPHCNICQFTCEWNVEVCWMTLFLLTFLAFYFSLAISSHSGWVCRMHCIRHTFYFIFSNVLSLHINGSLNQCNWDTNTASVELRSVKEAWSTHTNGMYINGIRKPRLPSKMYYICMVICSQRAKINKCTDGKIIKRKNKSCHCKNHW